jgi:hypothetical protein
MVVTQRDSSHSTSLRVGMTAKAYRFPCSEFALDVASVANYLTLSR